MPTELKNLAIEEVSFVDKPANPGARVLLMKRAGETKTEGGKDFPPGDYAYVPDPDKSSTWKLRLTSEPGGDPDPGIVGAAVAALGEGFRGNKVEIPDEDRAAVIARVRAAWLKANPQKTRADLPTVIKMKGNQMTLEEQITELNKKFDAAEVARKAAEEKTAALEAENKRLKEDVTKKEEIVKFASELPPVLKSQFDAMSDADKAAFMTEYKTVNKGGDDSPLAKALANLAESNKADKERIAKLEHEGELNAVRKEFASHPGVDINKHAETIVRLRKADPDAAKDLVEALKSAAEIQRVGNIFSLKGSDRSVPAGSAQDRINKAVEAILAKDSSLTKEQAEEKALAADPQLYTDYKAENTAA